jgi:hypothetical protein
MGHSLVCWKCGASLAALTLPLRRLEVCPACNAELHVCRMCVEYDTSKAKHCREPTAEEVRDKEHANFCDFYKPRPGAFLPADTAALEKSRAGLDALFGGAKPGASPGDESRANLDELFKPRKS